MKTVTGGLALLHACAVVFGREVSVADFGAVADNAFAGAQGTDSCLAFNRSIEAARLQNATVLRIPAGTYHFFWDSCPVAEIYVSNTVTTPTCSSPLPPKPIGMWLRDLSDLVVEGEGSTLLFHGLMTPIAVDGSHNVTVRQLAVDWVHPSVVEGLVTAATATSFDLQVGSLVHSSRHFARDVGLMETE